ncbi:hypothetical protein J4414_01420 [Candidatus Woesearchaeota archaeon]|nr:hypothetical protein [Candidatus Woesearchaeota archaeon]
MSEKDIVVPELKVDVKNSTFQMHELIKIMRSWADLNGYRLTEKSYSDKDIPAGKGVAIIWILSKDVDDYARFEINIRFNMTGRHVNIKKKGKGIKGDVTIYFDAILISDKENKWETPFMKFMRAFYDNIFQRDKFKAYSTKLDNECYSLYNEVKAFLNLHAEK